MALKNIPLDELVQVLRNHARLSQERAFSLCMEAAALRLEIQDELLASYAKHLGSAPAVTVHKSSAVGRTEVPDGLLDNYKIALQEFLDKTEWVQKTCAGHELGMHRADVLKQRIENLQLAHGELDMLKAEIVQMKRFIDGLRDLCGYVENGTSTTLKISQDDATKDWVVTVGKDSVFGRTFKDVITSAVEKFGGGL